MTGPDSPWDLIDRRSLHTVRSSAQADVLADPHRSRFLFPFLGRASSVSQAAVELGCTANAMLYRVRRMQEVGLLEVTEVRARAGRPVRVYRAPHDGYFVPNQTMAYDDLRHRVASHEARVSRSAIDAYTSVLLGSGNAGRVVARDSLGNVWSTDLPPATDRRGDPVFTVDLNVELTRQEAQQIRDLLAQAADRAVRPPRPERALRRSYLVRALVLPVAPE